LILLVIPADHYGYTVDQKTVDLGESVDVLVVAYRTKAMEFNQADNTVFTVFDPKLDEKGQPTGEFKRIMDKSELADSGCMFGLEYLIWLPQLEKFATLFMGTKSNRRTAPQLNDRLLKGATLKSKLIETKKYTWTAIDVFECSQISPMPTEAEVTEQYNKFINPKEASTETIEEETTNSSGEGRSY